MTDWSFYKGLPPFTLSPGYIRDWGGGGTFNIGSPRIVKRHNEGNRIACDGNPVWTIDFTGKPVTRGSGLSGYFWKEECLPGEPIGACSDIDPVNTLRFSLSVDGLVDANPGYISRPGYEVIGTIVDFQKISTDPIKVKSLVKVDIDDYGITDYLPLIYPPTPQYWDTDEHLAIDFNEVDGCYENAWMSYRIGDVVKVLLDNEGNPAAVSIFADGVFRIGEDILKSVCKEVSKYSQMSKDGNDYADGPLGPDGVNLGLLRECQIQSITGSGEIELTNHCVHTGFFGGTGTSGGSDWLELYSIWGWTKVIGEWFNYVVLVPIGPIIYRCSFYVFKSTTYLKLFGKYTFYSSYVYGVTELPDWFYDPVYTVEGETPPDGATEIGFVQDWYYEPYDQETLICPDDMVNTAALPPDSTKKGFFNVIVDEYGPLNLAYSMSAVFNSPGDLPYVVYSPPDVGTIGPDYLPVVGVVDSALYNEETASDPMSDEYGETEISVELSLDEISEEEAESFANDPGSFLQLFVRPHTLEELIAAGLV